MKAKLIKSLRINGQVVAPLKNTQVTLVELPDAEFKRLSDLGKVSKPSEDDLKIGRLVGKSNDTAAASDAGESDTPSPDSATTGTKVTETKGRTKTATTPAAGQADDAL